MSRPNTRPEPTPTGGRRMTVKRACDRCGRELGDATKAELEAAIDGDFLPSVVAECGCLVADAAVDSLGKHWRAALIPYPAPHWECICGTDLGTTAADSVVALVPHHMLLARDAVRLVLTTLETE